MKLKTGIFYYLIIVFLSACTDHKIIEVPEKNSATLKIFEDAPEVQPFWSKKNTIIYHVISEPDNLHPTNGISSPRSEIFQYIHRTLLYIDFSNQSIKPGLVKSLPEISADGLNYTYFLRENIFWDDGSALSIEDIEFTAKAFKCPLTNNPAVKLYWENIENIISYPTEPGKFTIIMKKKHIQNTSFLTGFAVLERSFYDPDNLLSSYTLNQLGDTAFKADADSSLNSWANEFNDDKYGRDPLKMNGLGMYNVTQWIAGQSITLTRKLNHWSHRSTGYHEVSYPKKIIFKLNKDESSQILEFRSQAMDLSINLSIGSFLQLNTNEEFQKNYNLSMMPTFNYTYICFNMKPDGEKHKKIFDDVRVRRALAMLTPVENITRFIYKQYSEQCYRVISNVSPLKKEFNSDLKAIPYDINSAEKLLSEAGWNDTNGDGILDKIIDGKKTSLTADLNYLTTAPEWKSIALLTMESFAKAGISINPVAMDLKIFLEKAKGHDFDLMLGSWSGTGLPEDYTQLWHSSSWINHGSNYSGFGNIFSDILIDSLKYELNESKRFELSHKLQKEIYNQQPYIFLYSSLRRNVIHKRFANQMLFSERPGILANMLRLMSIKNGITNTDEATP